MNRRRFCQSLALVGVALGLPSSIQAAQPALQEKLDQLCRDFEQEKFPVFAMGLEENLQSIPDEATLERQRQWLKAAAGRLPDASGARLSGSDAARLEAFRRDLEFLTEWNALSLIYRRNPKEVTPSRGHAARTAQEQKEIQKLYDQGATCVYLSEERWKGLVCLPEGGRWYDLYARFWTSLASAEACQPVQVAQDALTRCDAEVTRLLGDHKLETYLARPEFTLRDERVLQAKFAQLDQRVRELKLFSQECPPVKFAAMPKGAPVQAPGFYREGVFYYNFSDSKFPRQNLVWLYLHEALPGHHAQWSISSRAARPRLLQYPGMMEGWGVYAEHLGAEAGLMAEPIDRLGWVLWDQVRSARVYLDWMIHREGWTCGQAMEWWQQRLPHHRERAHGEVARVLAWPGQSLSYKIGELQLLALRDEQRRRWGADFRPQAFQDRVLAAPYSSWSELRLTL